MPTYGYLVYLLRANQPMRPRELHRLSALGDNNDDFLELIDQQLTALGSSYHREEKSAEGYRVKVRSRAGRTLEVRINKGPEGSTGEAYNTVEDTSVETTEQIALLSGLRALFVIPKDSYYGILFVERIGIRHLKELLNANVIRLAGQAAGVVTRVEAFAESKDWERDLAPQQTLRVSELLESTSSGDDASTPVDTTIRISAEGGHVRRASDRIKELIVDRMKQRESKLDMVAAASNLTSRRRTAGPNAFTVQDAQELETLTEAIDKLDKSSNVDSELIESLSSAVPVDRSALSHKRYEVALGQDSPVRTFVIESDAIPQFVYELGGRLTDAGLRSTWLSHAESLLVARGVTLPRDWRGTN